MGPAGTGTGYGNYTFGGSASQFSIPQQLAFPGGREGGAFVIGGNSNFVFAPNSIAEEVNYSIVMGPSCEALPTGSSNPANNSVILGTDLRNYNHFHHLSL